MPSEDGIKICHGCECAIPPAAFPQRLYPNGRRYADTYCWPCRRVHARSVFKRRKWTEDQKARKLAATNRWRLRNKYGLTDEELDMIRSTSACEICGTTSSDQWCIDHDHATGKVRGLLCRKCNFGLGQFQDDPELLRFAAKYLEDRRDSDL